MAKTVPQVLIALSAALVLSSCAGSRPSALSPGQMPKGAKPVVLSKGTKSSPTLGAKLTNSTGQALDGIRQVFNVFDLTRDVDAPFPQEESLGQKALGAAGDILSVLSEPMGGLALQTGIPLAFDANYDARAALFVKDRKELGIESRTLGTFKKIGKNLIRGGINVPKGVICGA